MNKKEFTTACGTIVYWTNDLKPDRKNLIFLPGLSADHRLFEKQIEYFKESYNIFAWDAPGHNASRPFEFNFDLMDKAKWLHAILENEGMKSPILIGQSMGGYVSQAYIELYPKEVGAFVSIDSAPLPRSYVTWIEIFLLKYIEPVYKLYPWKSLVKAGSKGVATTSYGQKLMYDMTMVYDNDHAHYCKLVGHGYRMLAHAMEADLPYKIVCPAILICGEKDKAGSAKHYNKVWTKKSGIPMHWIKDAGHNSNTDKPEEVNQIIEQFIKGLS